jgi:cold-inducible RNA-binding protein
LHEGRITSTQENLERDTARSKGFGFVELGSEAGAQAAIDALNDFEYDGRRLPLSEARPREGRGGSVAAAAVFAIES